MFINLKTHVQLLSSPTGIISDTPGLTEPAKASDLVKLAESHSFFLNKGQREKEERERIVHLPETIPPQKYPLW